MLCCVAKFAGGLGCPVSTGSSALCMDFFKKVISTVSVAAGSGLAPNFPYVIDQELSSEARTNGVWTIHKGHRAGSSQVRRFLSISHVLTGSCFVERYKRSGYNFYRKLGERSFRCYSRPEYPQTIENSKAP